MRIFSDLQFGFYDSSISNGKGAKMKPSEINPGDTQTPSEIDQTQPRAKYEPPVLETHGVWVATVGVGSP